MRRLILTAAAVAAATLPAAALAGPAAPEVPGAIAVPDGHKPYLVAHAEGVQIYECSPSATWRLVAPRATLTGENDKVIGSHYAGPRWETRDGSIVTGARDAGTNVDPSAVDWLRLKATSTTEGRLAATTYIQRIHTVGGIAPAAADCTAGSAGQQREIPYSADYVFFKATGS